MIDRESGKRGNGLERHLIIGRVFLQTDAVVAHGVRRGERRARAVWTSNSVGMWQPVNCA